MTLLPDVGERLLRSTCTCGRTLTRPSSIAQGQGPICWARTHPAAPRARVPRRRAVMAAPAPRRAAPGDGQLQLDIATPGGQL